MVITSLPIAKKIVFCPICHRRIDLPEFIKKSNIKSDRINVTCGNCKKGKVKINGN